MSSPQHTNGPVVVDVDGNLWRWGEGGFHFVPEAKRAPFNGGISLNQRSLETLRALAASGRSGFAKAAQRELAERLNEALRKAVAHG